MRSGTHQLSTSWSRQHDEERRPPTLTSSAFAARDWVVLSTAPLACMRMNDRQFEQCSVVKFKMLHWPAFRREWRLRSPHPLLPIVCEYDLVMLYCSSFCPRGVLLQKQPRRMTWKTRKGGSGSGGVCSELKETCYSVIQ